MKTILTLSMALLSFCVFAKPARKIHSSGEDIKQTQNFHQQKSSLFLENKGQIIDQNHKQRKDIDFKLEANGMVMFVDNGELHYQWFKQQDVSSANIPLTPFQGGTPTSPLEGGRRRQGDVHATPVEIYRLEVELIGANKNAELITEHQQDYTENYYLPQCPDGATAKSYTRIIYKNVYPHIDWVLYTAAGKIKYDFVIGKGGNYKDIQIQYKGASKLELKDGALIATTPFGSITENAPYTYYANSKEECLSTFVLKNNILSYNVIPNSNKNDEDLIIDPILKWATYYGGSSDDYGQKLATDTAGNIYMAGNTSSSSNIATTGAHQTSLGGTQDGFIAKFNINGIPQWVTYYGGADDDEFFDISADMEGNVYAAGQTGSSSGIASSGAYQTSLSGVTDGLLVKFSTSGTRQWATYFGGIDYDQTNAVVCGNNGDVYIGSGVGVNSTGLATAGAYQTTFAGGVITKFSGSGSRIWCTYYNAVVNALAIDPSGNICIGGWTTVTGMATTGAFQTTIGGLFDAIVAKFNGSGARLWATYYGGTGNESTYDIHCDILGNVYLGGLTPSTGSIAAGGHQMIYGGGGDAYLVKFNSSGARQWGTYYGGTLEDRLANIVTDSSCNVYIFGFAQSVNNISSTNGYQTSLFGGGADAFFAGFNSAGARLFGSYYGGTGGEVGPGSSSKEGGIGFTKNRLVFCKTTNSTGYIATTGAYQTSIGGNYDAFLVSFELEDTSVFLKPPFTDTFRCAGDSIHVPYGVTYNFRSTNVFTLQLSNASGSFASATTLATITGGAAGVFHCVLPGTVNGSGYRLRVIASGPVDTSEDNGTDLRYVQYPLTPVASANTPLCSGNTLNLNATGTTGAVWNWTGPASFTASTQNTNITNTQTIHSGDYIVSANLNNGCIRKDTVTVVVNQTPAKPNANSNSPLCSGNTLNLTASTSTSGVSWSWGGPNSFGSSSPNPSISNVQTNQSGDYIVTAILGPCTSKDTTTVVVNPGPTINTYVNPKDTICAGGTVTLVALVTGGGTGPGYQWYKNGNLISGATSASYAASGLTNGDVFYCKFTPGSGTGCNGTINSSSITITVLPTTNPSVAITAAPDTNIWQGLNVTFTAVPTNCAKPAYQWKLNNNNVNGATTNTWGAATLANNDVVSCIMTCNDPCPNPKDATSNKLTIHVSTGVQGVSVSAVSIYPNPVSNELIIDGASLKSKIQITDVLGREVYRGIINSTKQSINTSALVSGTYVLQLTSLSGERVMYKIVKE